MGSISAARKLQQSNVSDSTTRLAPVIPLRPRLKGREPQLPAIMEREEVRKLASSMETSRMRLQKAILNGKDAEEIGLHMEKAASSLTKAMELIERGNGVQGIAQTDVDSMYSIMGSLIKEYSKQKDKGAFRRSAEPPSDHWLIAWFVWYRYVEIMLKSGIRVSEESRRIEHHEKTVVGRS